jgi:hypothetical protein
VDILRRELPGWECARGDAAWSTARGLLCTGRDGIGECIVRDAERGGFLITYLSRWSID